MKNFFSHMATGCLPSDPSSCALYGSELRSSRDLNLLSSIYCQEFVRCKIQYWNTLNQILQAKESAPKVKRMTSNATILKTLPKLRSLKASRKSIHKFVSFVDLGQPLTLNQSHRKQIFKDFLQFSTRDTLPSSGTFDNRRWSNNKPGPHSKDTTAGPSEKHVMGDATANSVFKVEKMCTTAGEFQGEFVLRRNSVATKGSASDLDKENKATDILMDASQDSGLTADEAAAFDELTQQLKEHYSGSEDRIISSGEDLLNQVASETMTTLNVQVSDTTDYNDLDRYSEGSSSLLVNLGAMTISDEYTSDNLQNATISHSLEGNIILQKPTECFLFHKAKIGETSIDNNLENENMKKGLSGCYWIDLANSEINATTGRPKRLKAGSKMGELKKSKQTKSRSEIDLPRPMKKRLRKVVKMEHSSSLTKNDSDLEQNSEEFDTVASTHQQQLDFEHALRTVLCIPEKINPVSYKKFQNILNCCKRNREQNANISKRARNQVKPDSVKFNDESNKCKSNIRLYPTASHSNWFEDEPVEMHIIGKHQLAINSAVVDIDCTNYVRETDIPIQKDLSEKNEAKPVLGGTCKKQYGNCELPSCMLGCVCESINQGRVPIDHCGKLDCSTKCICQKYPNKMQSDGCILQSTELIYLPASNGFNADKIKTSSKPPQNYIFNEFSEWNTFSNTLHKKHVAERTSIAHLPQEFIMSKNFYFYDISLGMIQRVIPCPVLRSELPLEFSKLYKLNTPRSKHWSNLLTSNGEPKGDTSYDTEFMKPVSVYLNPVVHLSSDRNADILLSQSGLIMAILNWKAEKNIVPNTMLCCTAENAICVYPWLTLSKPSIEMTWLFYQLPHDVLAMSKLWLLEIGVVLVVGELLEELKHENPKDVVIKYCFKECNQKSLNGPDYVYLIPRLPSVIIYGPVSKDCIISDPNTFLEYVKWFEDIHSGPGNGFFCMEQTSSDDIRQAN